MKCKYIIVPDLVLENEKLNSTEKLLMGIIYSLNYDNNVCFASNNYLSKRLKVSKRTITSAISKLKREKLIEIKVLNQQRTIYLNNTTWQNTSIGVAEYC